MNHLTEEAFRPRTTKGLSRPLPAGTPNVDDDGVKLKEHMLARHD